MLILTHTYLHIYRYDNESATYCRDDDHIRSLNTRTIPICGIGAIVAILIETNVLFLLDVGPAKEINHKQVAR